MIHDIKVFDNHGNLKEVIDGKKYFDMTAGFTAHAVIGWNNEIVNQEISNQLKKITHHS